MNRKLRVAQYGCGKMAVYTMRYVYEKGGEIVSAFDVRPEIIGKDIGELIGGAKKGVIIRDAKEAESVFVQNKPDICIVTTMSLLKDLRDAFLICAKTGVNAISTCEEAFYPQNSSPVLTKEIDELAKKNNCTICGSGYQDVFWGNLITVLSGATQTIKKIKGKSSYNVEDYGIALAKAHGSGLDLAAFDKEVASVDKVTDAERKKIIESGEYLPSYMWNVNGWLCGKLGLTVVRQTQKTVPQTYSKDLKSSTLKMTVPAGYATGMSAVVTTETKEGITIESECIGKVYAPEEFDCNDWTIEGEPNTQVIINRPATVELTCATVVGRLADVINAEPGYVTTDKMPEPIYKIKPLNEYVK
ncbi:MAG: dihydrodipicolinate reductase [Elusimicrobiota bacterium]|jgi:4-hydroxy-tetrahydrodipicolinate reductase|nr:dihydrodipicolinate reductase [Elusimicrobiota bacterium]